MFAVTVCALAAVGAACAAPVFDVDKFNADMTRAMASTRALTPSSGIINDKYRVTMKIDGYEESDFTVKTIRDQLSVTASKDYNGIHNNVRNVVSLPDYVQTPGSWDYKDGVFEIEFPLKKNATNKLVEKY